MSRTVVLVIFLQFPLFVLCQTKVSPVSVGTAHLNKKAKQFYEYCLDSTARMPLYIFRIDNGSHLATSIRETNYQPGEETNKKNKWITVHGNILYDVNYYSNIDTPYVQKDVYQHTVQTYLDITLKNQYPLRFYFTSRFGNSYVLKDFNDVNLFYNSIQFRQNIKEQLKQQVLSQITSLNSVDSLRLLLDRKQADLLAFERKTGIGNGIQKLSEARERDLLRKRIIEIQSDSLEELSARDESLKQMIDGIKISGIVDSKIIKDSILHLIINRYTNVPHSVLIKRLIDSVITSTKKESTLVNALSNGNPDINFFDEDRKKADSLRLEIAALEKKYRNIKAMADKRSVQNVKDIDAIQNAKQLAVKMAEFNISDTALPKGYKTLMALRSIGLGRTIVNYSELSVKNISVNGVQVEYNPGYYIAFAAGTVDYRFRDFIVQNQHSPKQYVGVVRFGVGMKDGNNVIFTYYAGRRQLYNYFTDTINQNLQSPSPYLMGFTVEANYKLGKYNQLTGEIAKSSMPYYSTGDKSTTLVGSSIRFSDHSNEAYSVKLASYIPKTQTNINAYFKRLGINFQSFSIFTNGSSQNAWNIKVIQPFFKRTLELMASVNANDFSNPYVPGRFKSSTIFKSIQATLRKKKWPVVSVGYFPSSQLMRLSDQQYVQNLFYTLTGNLSHYYRAGNNMYSTSVVYTQFYNQSADTNFVYFNTKNILLNQTVFFSKVTLQINASESINNFYQLYTGECNAQVQCNKWFSLGGGIKYNYQTTFNAEQLGYSGNMTIKVPLLGEFRLMVDKGFIPGPNRQLVSNNVGRFTYFKTF